MPRTDMSAGDLRAYAPSLAEPADLGAFWAGSLAQARHNPVAASFTPVDSGLRTISSYDVTFAGYGGSDIRAWLHLPGYWSPSDDPLPAVVQYQGYGGGRGLVQEDTFWAAAGYAHLIMDTRGQGSGWSSGHTADPEGSAPAQPGFMTRGIGDPGTYYYRRVFIDAVRAVEAAQSHPAVDASRIAVTGASQGGGITIAVASLVPALIGAMPDVPFLADFRRAVDIAGTEPYAEIERYLASHRDQAEAVFGTLSYFDAAVLGRAATAPALFSVAHMDQTCPPSTVYAAYNAYGGPKEICDYEFNDHEGGQMWQRVRQLRWLGARLADAPDGAATEPA
jgi:cephalosporin-C deacetylase